MNEKKMFTKELILMAKTWAKKNKELFEKQKKHAELMFAPPKKPRE